MVSDAHSGGAEPLRVEFNELKERLDSAHQADRCGRGQASLLLRYLKFVGFVLAHRLNLLTRVIAMENQCCLAPFGLQAFTKRDSGLLGETLDQACRRSLNAGLAVSFQCHAKAAVNHQATGARFNFRR